MSVPSDRFCMQCGSRLAPNAQVCSACGSYAAVPSPLAPTQLASSPYPMTPNPGYSPPVIPPPEASYSYGNTAYGSNPYGSNPYASSPYEAKNPGYTYTPTSTPEGTYAITPPQEGKAARTRTTGVTILAVLVTLQAIDDLLSLLIALIGGNIPGIVILGMLTAATITLAIGLWTVKRWAFWTAIVVEILYLLIALLNIAQNPSIGVVIERLVIEVAIPLAVLIGIIGFRSVRTAIRRK